jgi:Tol biopolymer transport system component
MKRNRFLIAAAGSIVLFACADHGTNLPTDPKSPEAVIADDARLAFASSRGGRWSWPDIYLANGDGTGVRRLTVGTDPTWSPDGQSLAFYRDANPYDRSGIYIINADGSAERFLGVGFSPAWASDGRIAFSIGGGASHGRIAVMNPDGGGFRRLLDGSSLVTADDSCEDGWLTPHVDHPAWSPDSRQITFVITCSSMWSKLFVMNDDGSEPRLLVDSWQAFSPAWSPDGSRIAAVVDGAISVLDVRSGTWHGYDGTGVYQAKVDWSPDGRQLLFAAGDPGKARIFVLELETGDVRQLVPGTVPDYYADFDAAWSRVKP